MSSDELNEKLTKLLADAKATGWELDKASRAEDRLTTTGNYVRAQRELAKAAVDALPDLLSRVEALQQQLSRAREALEAVRDVIERGYPRTGEPFDECEHGRVKIDDCIGCYDEALIAALEGGSLSLGDKGEATE